MIAPLDGTPAAAPHGPVGGPRGVLENPAVDSFQSGIGVLSGWVCDAEVVTLVIDDLAPQRAAYGTERLDTVEMCGDADNGFGWLFNWSLLKDGVHTVRALADGMEFAQVTFTVTTLGGEDRVLNVTGETLALDFPEEGTDVRLVWQEELQNFMIAPLVLEEAGP